jgi:hypothetical protein
MPSSIDLEEYYKKESVIRESNSNDILCFNYIFKL